MIFAEFVVKFAKIKKKLYLGLIFFKFFKKNE